MEYEGKMREFDKDLKYKEALVQSDLLHIAEDLELATKFFITENPEIINLFVEGKRDELYLRTKEFYSSLNKKLHGKLAVMHFYKPGTKSFLRMHKPQMYGDVTGGHRPFLKEIDDKELKKPLTGFEAGRFSIAYRVEVPLFLKGKYIGIMDYGVDVGIMSHFLGIISSLESAVVLTSKKAEPILYKEHKQISQNLQLYSATSPLYDKLKKMPEKEKITFLSYEGKVYALNVMPLFGYGDKELAQYVMALDVTDARSAQLRNIILGAAAAAILILITLFIFRKSFLPLIKELHEQKELLTEAQFIAKIGNWTLDMNDNSVVFSEEVFRIVGMEVENPKAKQRLEDMMRLIHPDDVKKFEDEILSRIKRGEDAALLHRIINKESGQTAYVSQRCKTDKKTNTAQCIVQEVTELILSKQAEAEAKKRLGL